MQLTFLGTGTSHGIPVIGCTCDVCRSVNEKNKRTRASVWIEAGNISLLIDTATEFRLQAVREVIMKIDFVLLTHSHADHIHGMDDLRPLSKERAIPVYGNSETIRDIKKRFSYITGESQQGGGKPRLIFTEIPGNNVFEYKSSQADCLQIKPIAVRHGSLDILGYRIGNLAYITDCSFIPQDSMEALAGIETLILGSLRYKPHPTHFSVDEALTVIEKSGCRKAYLTHMCHNIEHDALEKQLPPHVKPAYDGLKISF